MNEQELIEKILIIQYIYYGVCSKLSVVNTVNAVVFLTLTTVNIP